MNLKQKLVEACARHPSLKLPDLTRPTAESMRIAAQQVENYLNNNGQVVNDDPLHDWLDEYRFLTFGKGSVSRTV